MENYIAPLIAAVLMILIDSQGEKLARHIKSHHHNKIICIGAGLVVGTFFIEILPPLSLVNEHFKNEFNFGHVYLLLLAGFIVVYILHALHHKRFNDESNYGDRKSNFEFFTMTIYGFILGFIIVLFFDEFSILAFIMLIPFYVREFAVSLTLESPSHSFDKKLQYFSQYAAPLLGTIIALVLFVNNLDIFYIVFSFLIGIFLYILMGDIVPSTEKVSVGYFIAGVVIAFLISLIFVASLYIYVMRFMVL